MTGYPSIDKPWLKYFSEEAISTPIPEHTMYEFLYQSNKDQFDDVALIYYGKKITYLHSAAPGGHGCGVRTATGRSQNGQLAAQTAT